MKKAYLLILVLINIYVFTLVVYAVDPIIAEQKKIKPPLLSANTTTEAKGIVCENCTKEIEKPKRQIESLVSELEKIDSEQRRELSRLQKQSREKGEFETTQQYEERTKKQQDEWLVIYNQVENQEGAKREEIYKQINSILSKEFSSGFDARLGNYDADKQQFPLFVTGGFQEILSVPLAEARELKENFSKAETIGSLGLVLDGNKAKEYLIWGKIKYNGKTYNINTINFDSIRAMKMVFGNYNERIKVSSWKHHLLQQDSDNLDSYVPASVYARFLTLKTYQDNGIEKKLLITKTAPESELLDEDSYSCHGCSVVVSLALFNKQNGYWKVEQVQKNTGRFGSWGQVPLPEIVKIGNNKYALKYDLFNMGMGYETGWEDYIAIDKGKFNAIYNVITYSNNLGAAPPIKDQINTKSKVVFRPVPNSVYYDIYVNTTGKKGKLVGKRYILSPFVKTEIYKFSNGKYELVK